MKRMLLMFEKGEGKALAPWHLAEVIDLLAAKTGWAVVSQRPVGEAEYQDGRLEAVGIVSEDER